jgi:phage-related protein
MQSDIEKETLRFHSPKRQRTPTWHVRGPAVSTEGIDVVADFEKKAEGAFAAPEVTVAKGHSIAHGTAEDKIA